MFGINQIALAPPVPPPKRWGDQNAAGLAAQSPAVPGTVGGVSAGVSVSTGLLTLVVIGGVAYLLLR